MKEHYDKPFDFGHYGEVEKILAWMPLPEPYKPQESEKSE